ncbi:hypothetical protein Clacol_002921 [Clathrus columnatus]|uniref:BRO1 domain-containing protein n=1 Tax=Clathrus columnatus TaxID=1419009 RepID=A0AAV5A243_9AGAM|nr:hypothetical protein Clacol_002921 [Clathrus columnatus]
MSNLLTLPFKSTEAISLKNAVKSYIQREHTETHPDAFKWDINKWESLRKDATTNTVHISNGPFRYQAQLIFIATKLPPDATLYCNLAVSEDRSNGDGIKRSLAYFQNAAGVLSHIVSVIPTLIESLPPNSLLPSDLSETFFNALQHLMLAQAQESFWQRAVLEDVKVGLISKLAAKTANHYGRALEVMEDPQIESLFSRDWIAHVRIKHHHFVAAALYRKSIDDLGGNRYGEEIARLELAKVETKKGLDTARRSNVAKSVSDDIKTLSVTVETSLKRADRDNDLIYHQVVPSATSLPAIAEIKDVVAAIIPPGLSDPKSIVDEGNVILAELSGWGVLKAIDIYNIKKNDWLQLEIFQPAKDLDVLAEMQALNLPASLDALDKPIGLPPSLLGKAEEVRREDGMNYIPRLLEDLDRLSTRNRFALDKALDILDQEASEDEEMRAAFKGDVWTRPASYEANTHLTDAAKRYRDILENSENAGREFQDTWDLWSKNIEPLCWDIEDLERVVPSSTITTSSANGGSKSTQGHARALRSFLESLEDVVQSRTELVKRVHRVSNTDDVSSRFKQEESSLARWVEVRPEVFDQATEEELGKYDRYKEELEDNAGRQDQALNGIKEKNVLFLESRKEDPSVKARESALQALDLAYHKYRMLCKDLIEGIKFHNDLSTLIAELEDTCKVWVLERQKDVEWLVGSLNSVSLTGASAEEQNTAQMVASNQATSSNHSQQRSEPPLDLPPPDSNAWESISPTKGSRKKDPGSLNVAAAAEKEKAQAIRDDDFSLDLPAPNSSTWESISPPIPPSTSSFKKKTRKLAR